MLPPWLRQLFKKRFVGQSATAPIRSNLGVEWLEDRTVLNTVTWTGGSIAQAGTLVVVNAGPPITTFHTAKWSDGGNWNRSGPAGDPGTGAVPPQPGDDVIFPAGLSAAAKPPATGQGATFSWPVNSEIDGDFQINNLTILDDNYHIDFFPGDSFGTPLTVQSGITVQANRANVASNPTLTITGEIRSNFAKAPAALVGLSQLGPLVTGNSNLKIVMIGSQQSLRADDVGVLKISVPINEPTPGSTFATVPQTPVGLTKNGTGLMMLSGTSSFTGEVHITGGTLFISNAFALGNSTRGTFVDNGLSTLQVTGSAPILDSLVIQGAGVGGLGALTTGTDVLQTFDGGFPAPTDTGPSEWAGNINLAASASIGTYGSPLLVSGQITGGGNLTKLGPNTLALSNKNAYTGNTLINAGVVEIRNNDALSSFPLSSTTVFTGAALAISGNLVVPEPLFLNGDGPGTDGNGNPFGALRLITPGALANWTGPVTMQSNSSIGVNNSSTPGFNFTNLTISGQLLGLFDMSKVDQGFLTLPNANPNFGGNTFVRNGVVDIANALALGPANTKSINVTNAGNVQGTLRVEGSYNIGKTLTLSGQGNNSEGALRIFENPAGQGSTISWSGPIVLTGQTSIRIDPVSSIRTTGVISGSLVSSTLDKFGLGTLDIAANNTFLGLLGLREGLTILESASGLGGAGGNGTQVSAGAALRLAGSLSVLGENLTLSGIGTGPGTGVFQAPAGANTLWSGLVVLNGVQATEADISVGDGGVLNFSNVLSGDADLRKIGGGELRLTGSAPNQFVKNTFLDAGTLALGKTSGQALGGSIVVGDGVGGNNVDVLRLDASNQIPDAFSLLIRESGVFALNNFQETLGGVTAVSLTGGEIQTGSSGLLTLAGKLTTNGSSEPSKISGNLSLGGTTRTFAFAATPVTTLGTSRISASAGTSVTFSFTALNNPGIAAPSGNVKFFDNGNQIGGTQILTPGNPLLGTPSTASISTTALGVGTHVITAQYLGDPNYPPVTTTMSPNQVIVNPTEQVLLSSNVNPADSSTPVTFSYKITGPANTVVPTGTVTFFDSVNGSIPAPIVDSSPGATNGQTAIPLSVTGLASVRAISLATGVHTVTAVYSGDANYTTTTTTLLPTLVVGTVPVTSVSTSAEPALRGTPVTLNFLAGAAGGGNVPTGSVTFVDTTTVLGVTTVTTLGTAPIDTVFGTASLPIPGGFPTVGAHNITANYSGDAFYTPAIATLTPTQQVVNPTAASLSANTNPVTTATFSGISPTVQYTFVINGRPGQPLPQGFVRFTSNGSQVSQTNLVANGAGTASVAVSAPIGPAPVGSKNIVATFVPTDGNYLGTSVTLNPPESVIAVPTGASPFLFTSSNNPALPNTPITFTVSAPASTYGQIQFLLNGTAISPVLNLNLLLGAPFFPVNASFTYPGTLPGTYTITAVFTTPVAGSVAAAQTITMAPSQVVFAPISGVVTSSASPGIINSPITYTFTTATPAGLQAPAVGTLVTFRDLGGAPFPDLGFGPGVVQMGAGGVASITVPGVPGLTAGTHNIRATFAGDGFYQTFFADLNPRQVVSGGNPSQVSLTSSANTAALGTNVTYSYVAGPGPGQLPPTGTVQFFDFDGVNPPSPIGVPQVLFTQVLPGGGQQASAQVSTNVLTVGTHSITAVYSGDANYVGSTATLSPPQIIVNPPLTQIVSSADIQQVGQPVTFTMRILPNVLPNVTTPPATGTVRFFDNGNLIIPDGGGTGIQVVSIAGPTAGTASITTSTLALGTHVITAQYSGDLNYEPVKITLVPNESIIATPPPPLAPAPSVLASQSPSLVVDATISGPTIPGFAPPGVLKTGVGQLVLNTGNTYTGPTIQNGGGGTIVLGINNALPLTDLIINAGIVDLNGKTQTVASLSGLLGGVLSLTGAQSSLTTGFTGTSTTFGGALSGAGTLIKVGAGTLTLSGPSIGSAGPPAVAAYTGTTVIAGGTVLVTANQSGGAVTVQSGTTLGGTGMVGAVTVAPGGTVAPGVAGVGTLTATSITFNGGVLAADLSKVGAVQTSDQLVATTLVVGSANPILSLNIAAYANPLVADTAFTILTTTNPLPAAFRFARADGTAINNGDIVAVNGRAFSIVYGATSVTAEFVGLATNGTLTASANPTSPGAAGAVTLTASFPRAAAGDAFPQGTVTFSDTTPGTTFVPVSVLLNAAGVATTTATFNTIGTHALTATFSASTNGYLNAAATLTEVVNTPTSISLTTSSTAAVFGQAVIFTSQVFGAGGTPTGTVTFVNPATGQVFGTAALSGGVAQLLTTTLPTGRFTVQAIYSGDATFRNAATSVTQIINAVPLVATGTAGGSTVTVYDPQSGQVRGSADVFGAYAGGVKVASGDVNGDGYSDLIILGGPGTQNGHILIFSGRDFSPLADYRVGYGGEMNVASGDVNGDGKADVVLSSATDFDYVAVLSSTTQNVISAFSVFGGLRLGVTLAVGDFDGDGKADIYAGTAKPFDGTGFGAVLVVNGLTGGRMGTFLLPLNSPKGVSVAAADVNGDGRDDVAIGTLTPFGGLGPVVGVYDAASKGLINGFLAFPGQPVGVNLSSTDKNGDGRDEIVTGFTGGVPVVGLYTFDPVSNTFNVLDGFLAPGGNTTKGLNVGGS